MAEYEKSAEKALAWEGQLDEMVGRLYESA